MSEQADSTLRWGLSRELTPLEAIMWRADVSRTTRSTAMAVELLDAEPEWRRFVAAHEWGTRMVPRLCDRVYDPIGVWTAPVWVRDAHLDLRYHVRRIRLGGDGSHSELFSLAAQLAMTPFDRTRPPWEAVLVEGLSGGKAAYLLKFHHSLTDGLGLVDLLTNIHSHQRDPRPDKFQPDSFPVRGLSPVEVVTAQARRDLGAALTVARGGGALIIKALRQPLGSVADVARYAASARRVLSPPNAAGLPVVAKRGGSWVFVALDVSFPALRAAAKTAGGSLNDAFLAALLGAFRLYCDAKNAPVSGDATMPLSVPVSVRSAADPAGGNHFAPARLRGPVGVVDPVLRIKLIGQQMRAARSEPALESVELVGPVLARLPAPLLVPLAGGMTSANDLQASNVPGGSDELYLAGARIERIYPFAPLPGCAAMISLHTYQGMCCIGANLDSAAITDTETFGRCLGRGFSEVLSLAHGVDDPEVIT